MRSRVTGWLLLGTAFLACPCHLPLTLGLLAGLTGTGAVGGFFSRNPGLVVAIASAYFVLALAIGVAILLGRRVPGVGWLARCVVKPSKDVAASRPAVASGSISRGG